MQIALVLALSVMALAFSVSAVLDLLRYAWAKREAKLETKVAGIVSLAAGLAPILGGLFDRKVGAPVDVYPAESAPASKA